MNECINILFIYLTKLKYSFRHTKYKIKINNISMCAKFKIYITSNNSEYNIAFSWNYIFIRLDLREDQTPGTHTHMYMYVYIYMYKTDLIPRRLLLRRVLDGSRENPIASQQYTSL